MIKTLLHHWPAVKLTGQDVAVSVFSFVVRVVGVVTCHLHVHRAGLDLLDTQTVNLEPARFVQNMFLFRTFFKSSDQTSQQDQDKYLQINFWPDSKYFLALQRQLEVTHQR